MLIIIIWERFLKLNYIDRDWNIGKWKDKLCKFLLIGSLGIILL